MSGFSELRAEMCIIWAYQSLCKMAYDAKAIYKLGQLVLVNLKNI